MKNKRDSKLTKKRAKRNNYEKGTDKELKEHLNAAMDRLKIPRGNLPIHRPKK